MSRRSRVGLHRDSGSEMTDTGLLRYGRMDEEQADAQTMEACSRVTLLAFVTGCQTETSTRSVGDRRGRKEDQLQGV
jgi:hypothetical protein